MLSSDDTTDTSQVTDALERPVRPSHRRDPITEHRRALPKNTELLLRDTTDIPHPRIVWRQVAQLREENKRLRFELSAQYAELDQALVDNANLRRQFDKEVTAIHNSYQQEREQYQGHLQALMDEHNHLQESFTDMERRYMDLYHSFQDAVKEETQKILSEATQTIEFSSENVPPVFQDIIKTLELQIRQEEDKHLVEALYLKREVQRMAALLEQEHQQIEEERHKLVVMQNTAREQAELRQKTLEARLRARWKVRSIMTTVAMIVLLVTLQFLFLNLAHIKVAAEIAFFLLLPIIICSLLTFLLSGPFSNARDLYSGVMRWKSLRRI